MPTMALRSGVGALFVGFALACSSDSSTSPQREVASVEITIPDQLEINQPGTATAVVKDADGVPIDGGAVTWSSSFTQVAAIQPQTGEIFALRSGETQITATVNGKSATKQLIVSPPPLIINEVNPDGDLPGGWVELFNPTPHAVDLTGWSITSNDLSAAFTFPAGATIESGDYIAVNEVALPRGLNASDAVYLFSKYQAVSDQYRWTSDAVGTSYGRCPDGVGPFVSIATPTRRATNSCT